MSDSKTASKGGLEGVVAADSAISFIDGGIGELRYRGYLITELADSSDFVETTLLLLDGELPQRKQLESFRRELASQRAVPGHILSLLGEYARKQTPMDALRTAVSALSASDPTLNGDDLEVHRTRGVRLVAQLPTILAAYSRLREGKPVIAPDPTLGHAADFLRMLTGVAPTSEVERMLDVCLVLHAEHGFNASTFSARVTAATLSDMYSAIVSAIGTLKGPLHGGANTAVMEMLLEIEDVDATESHLDGLLAAGRKVMGFGHRVYKVVDPRALILKEFSRRLADSSGDPKWFEMSEKIEHRMKATKAIDMNVDFYSASTYHMMGVAPDLFTGIFAISRISGWVAHVLEQYANNRLIRPRSNYTGSEPRSYVELAARG